MQRLADRTGRTPQAISKLINPETGQIHANYFGVTDPSYPQWKRLHEMVGGDKPTAQQTEELMGSRQMKTIFSKMQDLLGIERPTSPSLYPTQELETAATSVKSKAPYTAPQTNTVSNFINPDMESGVYYGYDPSTKA